MGIIKTVERAIQKEKEKLIKKARRKGLYENFGQKEVSKLEDKYINSSSYSDEMNLIRKLIYSFSEWCAWCDDKTVENFS